MQPVLSGSVQFGAGGVQYQQREMNIAALRCASLAVFTPVLNGKSQSVKYRQPARPRATQGRATSAQFTHRIVCHVSRPVTFAASMHPICVVATVQVTIARDLP